MTNHTVEISPQVYARIGGVLYLIIIVLGAVGELFIRGRVIVPGDAMATAANLKAMESLWRFGIAFELFLGICTITFTLILYVLLRPVNRDLALLATFFGLVATAVETAYSLQLVEALYPLGNAAYLKAFTSEQLYAMTSLSIKAHADGFGIALLLFGCFFPFAGYLIFKSGYFPKAIGILYLIPGLSYLTSSFALILAPTFADRFYFVMAGPALIGEASLCLWLLIKGVNVQQWKKQVSASEASISI
jgi:Domain of unknown function (DUF4386)